MMANFSMSVPIALESRGDEGESLELLDDRPGSRGCESFSGFFYLAGMMS
jgi:hypothetical protein